MEQTSPRPAHKLTQAERLLKALATLARQLRQTFKHWNAVKAPRLGAALAYYTVFSLAPLLIIAILLAGAIFGQAAAQERIVGQISALMGPQGAAGVASLLAQQPFPGRSGLVPTVVSLATLLLGAVGLFGQLEDAFDTVWEVSAPPTKGIVAAIRQRILPFGMVLAVCFLLLVALVLNAALAAISNYMGPYVPYFSLVNTGVNVVLPLVVTTLLFAALFKSVPHVTLHWRDLWPGAALTAVLFTLGKIGIGLYLGHSSLSSASGATGSLLVVLVWVFYTAQILLFGAVFTWVYARDRSGPAAPSSPDVQAAPVQAAPVPTPAGALPGRRAQAPGGVWWSQAGAADALGPEAPPPSYLGALLAFAAGLGAGVLVALRNQRPSGPTR